MPITVERTNCPEVFRLSEPTAFRVWPLEFEEVVRLCGCVPDREPAEVVAEYVDLATGAMLVPATGEYDCWVVPVDEYGVPLGYPVKEDVRSDPLSALAAAARLDLEDLSLTGAALASLALALVYAATRRA